MRKLSLLFIVLVSFCYAFKAKKESHVAVKHQVVIDTTPVKISSEDVGIVFEKTEVPPKFIGGDTAFQKFLNLNIDLELVYKEKAPVGTYRVATRFIVEKDGSLTNLSTLTSHGYGLEQEAIRIFKLSPKWQPALQNGHVVRCFHTQLINIAVVNK